LIELLVVISIISLLSSIVLASVSKSRQKAIDIKYVRQLLETQKALELYRSNYGYYPLISPADNGCSGGGTVDTAINFAYPGSWNLSPYLRTLPSGPVEGGFWYTTDSGGKEYKLSVLGLASTNNVPASLRDNTELDFPGASVFFLKQC
jgi:type II secretory pathway pseudopilin PulG